MRHIDVRHGPQPPAYLDVTKLENCIEFVISNHLPTVSAGKWRYDYTNPVNGTPWRVIVDPRHYPRSVTTAFKPGAQPDLTNFGACTAV
ncbi:hypothetical protein [Streptomyces cyaneofuscatus]|uniref:hypothetical protein n=1 Tax=Streptomyces cyaneofuscatus TaxID=66883 RepID=UPI003321710D